MTGDSERPVIVRTDVGHDQVMTAMRGARVVCVPSRWAEPQGLVAIEAMSVGTPVVASDIGGLRDVIEHEHSGLLVPPAIPTNSHVHSNAYSRIRHCTPVWSRVVESEPAPTPNRLFYPRFDAPTLGLSHSGPSENLCAVPNSARSQQHTHSTTHSTAAHPDCRCRQTRRDV